MGYSFWLAAFTGIIMKPHQTKGNKRMFKSAAVLAFIAAGLVQATALSVPIVIKDANQAICNKMFK